MNKSLIRYPKKGSVILVVVVIFVVLLIIMVSFFKSTSSRAYTTKKLGDTMLARELANSLAAISFHYLKNVELKNETSKLRQILSAPLPLPKDEEGDLIAGIKDKFKEDSNDIISILLEKSGLNEIKIDELSWKLHKVDFDSIQLGDKDSPFPREKQGVIRVYMKLSYKLPGQKSLVSEDYVFVSRIKVVANLFPVLSKFNLYVNDAFGNNPPSGDEELISRFNVVSTTAGGKLNNDSPACPWVLDNGANDNYYDSYNDFAQNPKGLVYLGGGSNDKPIVLGIARGFTDVGTGDFREDYHFYKKGTGGYWKTFDVWGQGEGILAAEIGLCDDESTQNLKTWQLMFGEAYKKQSKRNSIFRLYGTDEHRSPTLVLGYVDSMCGQVRAYKGARCNKLPYFDLKRDFLDFSGLGADPNDFEAIGAALQYTGPYRILDFSTAYTTKFGSDLRDKFEEYNKKYATRIVRNRYTKDYAYILTRNKKPTDEDACAYPLEFGAVIRDNDPLRKLCEYHDDDIYEKIPSIDNVADYAKIFKDAYNSNSELKLTELDKLFNKNILKIDGSIDSECNDRIIDTYCVKGPGDDIQSYLKFKRLLKPVSGPIMIGGLIDLDCSVNDEDRLDLNGWLYVDCDSSDDLDINIEKCRPISQGGIIVNNRGIGKANIRIKGFVYGDHVTFVTLKGDIIIEKNVKKLNASLIAPQGIVKLECDSNVNNNERLNITGNIVMKNITKDMIENNMKRPLFLDYYDSLAAIPYQKNQNLDEEKLMRTEYPLLMFDLKDDYKMLD